MLLRLSFSLSRFWSLLSPYCHTSAAVKGLPLVSSFGRGCGEMVAVDGQVCCGCNQDLLHMFVVLV